MGIRRWLFKPLINQYERIEQIMSKLDDDIAALQASVTNLTAVDTSAVALINGISAQIQTAVDAALAAGATDAQLQALTDLKTSIDTASSGLAAAVTANTPAPPAAPSA